jgi:putative ABC transport system permease protein
MKLVIGNDHVAADYKWEIKKYLEDNKAKVDQIVSLVEYKYSVSPLIYTQKKDQKLQQLNPSAMLTSMMGPSASMMSMSSMSTMSTSVFNQMLDDRDVLKSQYDVLAGRWPEKYDEVILILPEPNGMSDLLVYSLGLRDEKELTDMISKIMAGEKVENKNEPLQWTYDELMKLEFKLVNPTDTYKYNETYKVYESMKDDEAYMKEVYDKAVDLKVVGIMCGKKGNSSNGMMQGIAYTKELTQHVIKTASE